MIAIVCVDDDDGILFHQRRVSRDRILNQWILDATGGRKFWMRAYSKELFGDAGNIVVCEDYLEQAEAGAYCFVEDGSLGSYADKVESLLVCRWNRRYPSDVKLPEALEAEFAVRSVVAEFAGSSHDKITVEEWKR